MLKLGGLSPVPVLNVLPGHGLTHYLWGHLPSH